MLKTKEAGVEYKQHELYPRYQALWQQSWPLIRQGQISYDKQLPNKADDRRRGLTLIARLAPDVIERINHMLQALAAREPHQYYYPPTDIHLTILPLFTATEHYQSYLERLDDYRDVVATVLRSVSCLGVDSLGITLSTSAVLAQGFPHNATLNQIRDRLRGTLASRGLGASLDQRYHLVTAHSTLLRFTTQLQDAASFAQALTGYRHTFFGSSAITSLELVVTDWYMSFDKLTQVETYQLR